MLRQCLPPLETSMGLGQSRSIFKGMADTLCNYADLLKNPLGWISKIESDHLKLLISSDDPVCSGTDSFISCIDQHSSGQIESDGVGKKLV